jgi:hypothetical protein
VIASQVTAIDDLRPAEIEAAVALWEVCDLTRPWNDPRADIRRALAGPSSTILAHRRDGRLVATVMVGADGHRGWVYYLAVAPDLRKRGLGEAAAAGFYHAIGYETEDRLLLAKRLKDD